VNNTQKGIGFRIFFACALFLPSCSLRQSKKSVKGKKNTLDALVLDTKNQTQRIPTVRPHEARMIDVPLPLGAHPVQSDHDENTVESVALYELCMPLDDMLMFYAVELEREGWREVMTVAGERTVLVYEKPGRMCVIVIASVAQKRGGYKNGQYQVMIAVDSKR
jgi:hypothetical protein